MNASPIVTDSPTPRSLGTLIALGSVFVSSLMLINNENPLSLTGQLLIFLIANLGMLPAALYFAGNQQNSYPIFELTCAYLSVMFGWSAFSSKIDWEKTPDPVIESALWIALLGIVAFILCFYLTRGRMPKSIARLIDTAGTSSTFLDFVCLGFLGIAVLFQLIPESLQAGSLGQVKVATLWGGVCLGWLRYFSPGTSQAVRRAILTLTVGVMLILALIGSVKPLVVPLVIIGFSYWRVHRRIPYRMIISIALIYVTLNPVKFLWRQHLWNTPGPVSIVQNIGFFVTAFSDYYFKGVRLEEATVDASTMAVNRLSDAPVLSRAVHYTPLHIPYWNGETLKALPYALIPRFLWPDKPTAIYGNLFGRYYRLIGSHDTFTFISLSWITEFYINYGKYGVVLGMGLLGWLMRKLQDAIGAPDTAPLAFAIGVGASGELFNAGQNMALVWGGLPLRILVLIGLCHALRMIYERLRMPAATGPS